MSTIASRRSSRGSRARRTKPRRARSLTRTEADRLGQGEVACHVAEGHARRGGAGVVQELALVLGEVALVAAAQVHPHPAVGPLKSLSS